jgi:tungstate transport system substrate-binding protein
MAHRFRSLIAVFGLLAGTVFAQDALVVASTTSTEQSGLFGWILPKFEQATGIKVRVVAVGTGQALDIGRRGDADVLLVHDRAAEDKFVAEGYGSYRKDVMYNDFVIVGPADDPATIRVSRTAAAAFKAIAMTRQSFVSRGDKSGTHAAELRLWKEAGVDPKTLAGYKEAGSGMGPTLNMAAATGAYTLSDRATWYAFRNRQGLDRLFSGDPVLFNPYGVIPVNPARHPHVKKEAAERFAQWLTSPAGQQAIAAFRTDGQQVFFPNIRK